MIVERLFWEDSYLTECEAKVTHLEENKVRLDKTVFYAFSGGQISDTGTINGINVISARIIDNYDIEYELEEKPNFQVQDIVKVEIDWDKRYELMKLHTAQHIAANFFENRTNVRETLGGNIRKGKATLTYPVDEPITEILKELETKVNEFINQDHKVECWLDKDNSNRRNWKCAEFECGCGGTHVKSLKEIGKIKLKRRNGGKGKEEIEVTLA